MDARLTPLPSLSTIALTGGRRQAREAMRWVVLAAIAAAFIGMSFEYHRDCGWSRCDPTEPMHHLWDDVGPGLHLALLGAAALAYLGRSQKMVGSLLLNAGTAAVLFGTTLFYVLIHFLSRVEGDGLGAPGLLVGFGVSFLALCIEPILTVAERRRLVAGDPVLASARVVRS